MRYLVNPGMVSVRRNGKSVSRKAWRASGFRRNPVKRATPRQLAARKKFAAMARARATGARRVKRAQSSTEGVTSMARRKRRAVARRGPVRRRRSAARRRVYAANPRRGAKRRSVGRVSARRRYRRNPGMDGIVGQVKDLAVGAGAGLAGMALGRTVSNLIPFNASTPANQPLIDFAKGVVVAVGIRIFGEKMVGRDLARIVAIGALLNPTKNLVLNYAPSAGQFLGSSSDGVTFMPQFSNNVRHISSYPPAGNIAAYSGMGAYSGEVFNQ